MAQVVNKKVRLTLVGLDGNAFALMGAFARAARKEGWTKEKIEAVMTEAQSGDYNNLIRVLSDHCENDGWSDDEEDEFDDEDD
jgi:hypothetical protein